MKKLLLFIKCSISGHKEGIKSKCPFTGLTYTYCINCNNIYKANKE